KDGHARLSASPTGQGSCRYRSRWLSLNTRPHNVYMAVFQVGLGVIQQNKIILIEVRFHTVTTHRND
ncbi:MAG: hypothetical protein ACI92Z_003592, partial [Paracoccaceae bacterium]